MEDKPSKREQILQLRDEGKTYNEICEILQIAKSTVAYHANEQVKKNFLAYRNKNRKKQNIEIKEMFGGKCSICGYSKCLAALDFHHPDNNKEAGVGQVLACKGKKAAIEEAKKCILVCANCHREIHNV